MNELRRIALSHLRNYPALTARDLLKLAYQSEFGPGHLVDDEAQCRELLAREYQGARDCGAALYDSLGNGYCRVNLAAARAAGIPSDVLARIFFASALRQNGTVEGFLAKARALESLCDARVLPFSAWKIAALVDEWRTTGQPLFSHTSAYKNAYCPAYRVIEERFTPLTALIARIQERGNTVIGIDGRCGAGKTTLARMLLTLFDASVIHMDDFFLPAALRTEDRLAEPGGNIHYERFADEVMQGIESGLPFAYGAFDCASMQITSHKQVLPKPLTVVEGSYALHPRFDGLYDIRVFCTVDAGEQQRRIEKRNGPASFEAFKAKWIPMEEQYFQASGVESKCDFVLALSSRRD